MGVDYLYLAMNCSRCVANACEGVSLRWFGRMGATRAMMRLSVSARDVRGCVRCMLGTSEGEGVRFATLQIGTRRSTHGGRTHV
jgi:hypothetical protein